LRAVAEITAEDAASLLDVFDRIGVKVWVDGGWGVDALVGPQTRSHADLDIVVSELDLERLVEILESRGFSRVPTKDDKPWNFVLRDSQGREVDVHVVVFDGDGNGIYGPAENGDMYPAESLTGEGQIAGRRVRCISAEWQVRFHTGYEWDANDRRDVTAIADRYGIEVPGDPSQRKW
jgi:lincosamide nucleotidyltransferase A/C/D/E